MFTAEKENIMNKKAQEKKQEIKSDKELKKEIDYILAKMENNKINK